MDELLSLKWKNHCSTFMQQLGSIRKLQMFTDVTVTCSGKFFHAHKFVLIACSDYFREILNHTDYINPVIIMKDFESKDLELLLDYMYIGEVHVHQTDLPSLIKAAECLKIKGLAVSDDVHQKKYMDNKPINSICDNKRKRGLSSNQESSDESHSSKAFKMDSSLLYNHLEPNRNQKDNDIEPTLIKEEPINDMVESLDEKDIKMPEINQSNFEAGPPDSASTSRFKITNSNFMEDGIVSLFPELQKEPQLPWQMNNFDPQREKEPLNNHRLSNEKTDWQEHKCQFCFKTYTATSSLHRHMLNHTGEKSYLCTGCSYSTNRKDSLNRHMYMMHHVFTKKTTK